MFTPRAESSASAARRALARRERRRRPAHVVGAERELREQRPRVDGRRAPAAATKRSSSEPVAVEGRSRLVELAEDDRRPDPPRAACERQPAEQRVDQRRLAGAVAARRRPAARRTGARDRAGRGGTSPRSTTAPESSATRLPLRSAAPSDSCRRHGDQGFSTSSSRSRWCFACFTFERSACVPRRLAMELPRAPGSAGRRAGSSSGRARRRKSEYACSCRSRARRRTCS